MDFGAFRRDDEGTAVEKIDRLKLPPQANTRDVELPDAAFEKIPFRKIFQQKDRSPRFGDDFAPPEEIGKQGYLTAIRTDCRSGNHPLVQCQAVF